MTEIYMGLLDDKVLQYPWQSLKFTKRSYIDQLMHEIIIGRQPVINDGYLLQNRILRKALFEENNSFFSELLKTGEIIIPGRCNSFIDLIQQQREKGVPDFLKLSDNFIARVGKIDSGIARVDGPDSMDVWNGFFGLMKDFSSKDFYGIHIAQEAVKESDLQISFDNFFKIDLNNEKGKPPTRGQWEEVLENLTVNGKLSRGDETKKALMRFANEIYHYNFAQQTSLKFGRSLAVQTALSPAFNNFFKRQDLDVNYGSVTIPMISIPLPNRLASKNILHNLLDPGTNLGEARKHFIESIDEYRDAKKLTNIHIENLRCAAERYNKLLNEQLGYGKAIKRSIRATSLVIEISTSPLDGGLTVLCLKWVASEFITHALTHLATTRSQEIDYRSQTVINSPIVAASIAPISG